eukprot:1161509-Pelagomonas_calceolata.AAC.2
MSEEGPKAPGVPSARFAHFLQAPPPITEKRREEKQKAERKKSQKLLAQQRAEAAKCKPASRKPTILTPRACAGHLESVQA